MTITTEYVSTFDVPEDVAKAWANDEDPPLIYLDEHGDAVAFNPRANNDEEVHHWAVAHEDEDLEVDDTTIGDIKIVDAD